MPRTATDIGSPGGRTTAGPTPAHDETSNTTSPAAAPSPILPLMGEMVEVRSAHGERSRDFGAYCGVVLGEREVRRD